MKRIMFFLITAFLMITSQSCEKPELETFESEITTSNHIIQTKTQDTTICIVNGLLSFKSLESLKSTVASLESAVNRYDDSFLQENSHLTPEELEQKEEEIGYNEYAPLINFDDSYNFNSLFLKQAAAEREWLLQEELDIRTDPDNHFVEDKALQAIVNIYSEVLIGNAIYKMFDFGYVIITDGNFQTLYQIRERPNELDFPNVEIVGTPTSQNRNFNCKSNKTNSDIEIDGNYRIKWRVSHRTPVTGRRAKAVTINYKKRKFIGWKRIRAPYTKCMVFGFISSPNPGDCTSQSNFNPGMIYSDNYNKKVWYHRIYVETLTSPFWVKGYHKGINGIEYNSTLVW